MPFDAAEKSQLLRTLAKLIRWHQLSDPNEKILLGTFPKKGPSLERADSERSSVNKKEVKIPEAKYL